MVQISFRVDEDTREMLKLETIRSGKTQNEILTEAVQTFLEKEHEALENIKQAVTTGRARGARSQSESLRMAEQVAKFDDREGLGELQSTRGGPKGQTKK